MNQRQADVLRKLAVRALTPVTLTDAEIRIMETFVNKGLAWDHSRFAGRRTNPNCKIWSISEAGKAALLQQLLVDKITRRDRQLTLIIGGKPDDKDAKDLTVKRGRAPSKRGS